MKKALLVSLLVVITAYVTHAQGWGTGSRRAPIVPPCVPAVSSVAPTRGPNTGGVRVTLNGACFTGATRVSFDGRPARSFRVLSDTTVQAVSPTWHASRFPQSVLMSVCKPLRLYIRNASPSAVRCSRRNLAANFTFFKTHVSAPRSTRRRAPAPQANARLKAAQVARIKAMRRQAANRVHAAFLARKAKLQAQWLAVRITRGRRLLATHRSAPAALRNVLSRNISSLVTLRQTVVSAKRPLVGSFSAGVSRALFRGGTGSFHGFPHVVTPPPSPTITGLSPAQGQPGDQIIINGSGFGPSTSAGTVTFLLSPNTVGSGGTGAAQQATIGLWGPTQIVAYVPNVSGLTAYSGSLYVQAAGGQSNASRFQFQPTLDVEQLPIGAGNAQLAAPQCWGLAPVFIAPGIAELAYCGASESVADDWFFKNYTLRNGWTLDSIDFDTSSCPVNGTWEGASLASSGQGTNTPYVDVHWWHAPNWVTCYTLSLTITGPLGTQWQ